MDEEKESVRKGFGSVARWLLAAAVAMPCAIAVTTAWSGLAWERRFSTLGDAGFCVLVAAMALANIAVPLAASWWLSGWLRRRESRIGYVGVARIFTAWSVLAIAVCAYFHAPGARTLLVSTPTWIRTKLASLGGPDKREPEGPAVSHERPPGTGNTGRGGASRAKRSEVPAATSPPSDPPRLEWMRSIGGKGTDTIRRAAIDSEGNILLLGQYNTKGCSIDLGGGPLPALKRSSGSTYVAKLDPHGKHIWSLAFDHAAIGDLALDDRGNVHVTGSYTRWSNHFAEGKPCSGARHLFVVKLSPAGKALWAVKGRRSAEVIGTALAVDRTGGIYLAGLFGPGAVDLGGGSMKSVDGLRGAFLARMDRSGRFLWTIRLADVGMRVTHVSVDAQGNAIIGGEFRKALAELGEPPLVNISFERDIFVAKYDAGGSHLWSRRYGGMESDYLGGLAVAPDGSVALAGNVSKGPLDLGPGEVDRRIRFDMFALKLSRNGGHLWSLVGQSENSETIADVSCDAAGRVYLAGWTFSKRLLIGGQALAKIGTSDLLLSRIDADGKAVWAGLFGPDRIEGRCIVPGRDGAVIVAGEYAVKDAVIANHPLPHRGLTDLFVCRMRLPERAPERTARAALRSANLAPARVFRVGDSPPRNPLLMRDVNRYLKEVYLWLGLVLAPAKLDPLRRIDIRGRADQPPEHLARYRVADRIARRLLPRLLEAKGRASEAGPLRKLAPITTRNGARDAHSTVSAMLKKRKAHFCIEPLESMLRQDANFAPAPPSARPVLSATGHQHARDAARAIAYALSEPSIRDEIMREVKDLIREAAGR